LILSPAQYWVRSTDYFMLCYTKIDSICLGSIYIAVCCNKFNRNMETKL
jgi:hypothetical protein